MINYQQRISEEMKKIHDVIEENKDDAKVVSFPIITGGKGGGDWLSELALQTTFLTRPRGYAGDDYLQMIIADRSPKGAAYLVVNNGGNPVPMWKNSARFSSKHDLIEVLEDNKQEQEEAANAPSDRTDNAVRLELGTSDPEQPKG